jgi:hypothetical protein
MQPGYHLPRARRVVEHPRVPVVADVQNVPTSLINT